MFEPGHLRLQHIALQPHDITYDIHLHYQLSSEAGSGAAMHFTVQGEIAGNTFSEEFELPKDMACNFASQAERIAHKHGLPKAKMLPVTLHKQYDQMFEDVRDKLQRQSGDPVEQEHLE
jgi:hypothetical protein